MLTCGLAEVGDREIRVNCIAPYVFRYPEKPTLNTYFLRLNAD